jgi:SAM-dependent methyltransferase
VVLDTVVAETGLTTAWIVADVGSGTGLSAEPFLDHGNTVFAVEPNPAMRASAEALLGSRPGFRSVNGTAEATTLPPDSVDLVVAAQAFHWFRTAEARAEFARILRPDGWLALIWHRRRTDATPFLRAYEATLLRCGTDYEQVRHDRLADVTIARQFTTGYTRRLLFHEQTLDLDGLLGRTFSASYVPAAGDPRRAQLQHELEQIFAEHAQHGRVRIEYDTELHLGRVH